MMVDEVLVVEIITIGFVIILKLLKIVPKRTINNRLIRMNFKINNGHIVNPYSYKFQSTILSNINRLQFISSHATQWHEKKPKIFSIFRYGCNTHTQPAKPVFFRVCMYGGIKINLMVSKILH